MTTKVNGDKLRKDAIREIQERIAQLDEQETGDAAPAEPDTTNQESTMATKTTKKRNQSKNPKAKTPRVAKENPTSEPKAKRRSRTTEAAKPLSCLGAARKVLGEHRKPMSAPEMIEKAAEKGYWRSPGGKTPAATLYAAIIREISKKGAAARFKKVDRGQFEAA